MSQVASHSVANGGGAAVRSAMNGLFNALLSSNSGTAAPSPTQGGMFWLDTDAVPPVLYVRNAANTAWITLGPETVAANTIRGNSSGSAATLGDISMATLKTMLGWSGSVASPGYVVTPLGLILQWGQTGAIAAGGSAGVTYPLAFPNACFTVLASPLVSANNTSVFSVGARAVTTATVSITNNSGTSGSAQAAWLAIGN